MRKIQNLCAAAAFGFLFGGGIHVGSAKAQVTIHVPYNEVRQPAGCGSWLQARERRTAYTVAYETWVTGFLSGAAFVENTSYLSNREDAGLYLWVGNYCRQNPLESIFQATDALRKHLIEDHLRRISGNAPPQSQRR